jgi:ATP-dependent helicase HrpA
VANEAARTEARSRPTLHFKREADLPISARREEIAEALTRHQVLIVAGDTGSGKSTQLPQICLELGRGSAGLIAHTQPRRLAARALAARIAEELSQGVGTTVGFRVRFADRVSAATRLVLLTDGLLLAELASDPLLGRYDTIIVDEAHERTLNIDLLLGVLKRLLPRRPDLKVIVTSATLDVERVAQFFDGAPVVAVSGRNHPIEVRYAAGSDDAEDRDLPAEVLNAFREIAAAPGPTGQGDVLVFLPGEREIRDVGDLLQRELDPQVEVLALYSRLSWEQQSRIFQPGSRRRIVLATNVAETSITVPGIHAVIDSGLARISRYSPRNRLQRLPIEPVSRANADQRKGRCGRLGPGLCVRLYTEADFAERPAFTEPEVLRTNLAALLLRLAADRLGAAESFPFIDAPDARALGDGYRLLQELEALDADRRITRRGRAMARLPLDPRLARALLESQRFHAESELLAIVAGLSVPDARLAQSEDARADTTPSEAFDDAKSEFSGLVKLWRAYHKAREGPRRELRRWCRARGLSLLRLSEWDDVYAQVTDRAAEIGLVAQRRPASYTGVHRALLAGFCTMVGARDEEGAYLGTRGVHFHIFPGSPLKRRKPRWVMAANIVETSRVYARRVAEIEPTWIEAAAHHLLKREYLEPDWDEEREEVVARERVSFLGLTLSANRVVNYGPIAPEESRLIFAREALVYGRLARRPDWLQVNDAAILAAQRLEERLRTRDLVRAAEFFVDFYDKVLPRQVSSAATLDYFTRHLSAAARAALTLEPHDVLARVPDPARLALFPERIALGQSEIAVEYRFAPGEAGDGATLQVPLLLMPTLTRAALDSAVPGLAEPRVEALLRSLPKDARRALIPIGATAASFLASTGTPSPDADRLAAWLRDTRGVPESLLRFDLAAVPPHLTPRLAVMEPAAPTSPTAPGEGLQGDDLVHLRGRCAARARAELDRRARLAHPAPWRRFESETLGETAIEVGGGWVRVHATLAVGDRGIEVLYEWSAAEALRRLGRGATSLARLVLAAQARDLSKRVLSDSRLLLAASPYFQSEALLDLILHLAFRRACFGEAPPPASRDAFNTAVDLGRERVYAALDEIMALVRTWFSAARAVRGSLEDPRSRSNAHRAAQTQAHLRRLFDWHKLVYLSDDWIRQLPRYLKGEERRWQRLLARGGEPAGIAEEIDRWSGRADELQGRVLRELRWLPLLDELDGWIEEYRLSMYAQELRTLGAVSAARLETRAAQIEAWITR